MTVIGMVSPATTSTARDTAYPIFRTITEPPPAGRKTRLTVPVLVVSAKVPDATSMTFAPSIGSPVASSNTPSTREGYDFADGDCAVATALTVTNIRAQQATIFYVLGSTQSLRAKPQLPEITYRRSANSFREVLTVAQPNVGTVDERVDQSG